VDGIAHNQSEGPSAPRFGGGRPAFGRQRDQGKRIEITFVLKNGGSLSAIEEIEESLTAEVLADYARQLNKDLAEARPRTFVDGWNTGGQHAWVNLGEVVAFSLRPAK
jgi:hypothetical protein